jgi:hypothetical protein
MILANINTKSLIDFAFLKGGSLHVDAFRKEKNIKETTMTHWQATVAKEMEVKTGVE